MSLTASLTPLGAVSRGMFAGAVGTALMDTLQYRRYVKGGGMSAPLDWEFGTEQRDWRTAPAPAKVAKRLFEGLFQRKIPSQYIPLTNDLTHWLYGMSWGALYGLLSASARKPGPLGGFFQGFAFGTIVWSSSYVILPLAKLYKPMWAYDARTLAKDLGDHMLYGMGSTAAFALLRLLRL